MNISSNISSISHESPQDINIHFIWMGGKLPAPYLNNIKECAAKALSDTQRGVNFKLNLWTDKPIHYWKTACTEDSMIYSKKFEIRDLNDLEQEIQENYPESAKKIVSYVRRELIGFKNYAAASDILRYVILEKEGGYYFDTDILFSHIYTSPITAYWKGEKMWTKEREITTFFNIDKMKYGMKLMGNRRYFNTNGVIAAEAKHKVLKDTINEVALNYNRLDQLCHVFMSKAEIRINRMVNFYGKSRRKEFNLTGYNKRTSEVTVSFKNSVEPFCWHLNAMDIKRFPGDKMRLDSCCGRRQLTIDSSLTPLVEQFKKHVNPSRPDYVTPDSDTATGSLEPIIERCDNTWLKVSGKIRAVDDSEALSVLFQ